MNETKPFRVKSYAVGVAYVLVFLNAVAWFLGFLPNEERTDLTCSVLFKNPGLFYLGWACTLVFIIWTVGYVVALSVEQEKEIRTLKEYIERMDRGRS
jgi:hypothetical protein